MAEKIQAFESLYGQVYRTEEEAVRAYRKVKLEQAVRTLAEEHLCTSDAEHVIQDLIANIDEFLKLIENALA